MKLLKKKKGQGFLALLQSHKDLIMIDEEGQVTSICFDKINRIEEEIQKKKNFKLKLQYFHKKILKLTYLIKKLDFKFAKSKKKKKKDIEKHEA